MEEKQNTFTCDIDESTVEKIMLIDDIEDIWKLLLLMGIGVFTSHKSIRYTEIMKQLAHEQKLYLIIASDDYIYGTNYQFCHGYIGKDFTNLNLYMRLYGVDEEEKDFLLEIIEWLDARAIKKSAEQLKREYDKMKRKSSGK